MRVDRKRPDGTSWGTSNQGRKCLLDWDELAKPQQTWFIETLNGQLRGKVSNETLFHSLTDVWHIIHTWKVDYNSQRLHRSLNGLIPNELAVRSHPDNNNTAFAYERGALRGRMNQPVVSVVAFAAFNACH
jgi:hypothetical protein